MMKGSYRIVPGGDATKYEVVNPECQLVVIPHIVNDIGRWGSGFVVAITRAFGSLPEDAYRAWYNAKVWTQDVEDQFKGAYLISKDRNFVLGRTQFVTVDTEIDEPVLTIANMVGQKGIGFAPDGTPPIRYDALIACMKTVAIYAIAAPDTAAEIHTCKFGSERAGGDWKKIEQMIQEYWVAEGIPVVIYDIDAKSPVAFSAGI